MGKAIDSTEWTEFMSAWDKVVKAYPDAKRLALFEAGKSVLSDVENQIIARGIRDDSYHVRSWQRIRAGSGGGYVAVDPETAMVPGKGLMSRKITRYLDQGHGARRPSGKTERYRPRIQTAGVGAGGNVFVRGRQFYSYAAMEAQAHAEKAAEHVLVRLENMLYDLGFDV